MSYSDGDVSVAPCSPTLAALCALGNEADVHFLRLLGRSCARHAELALVCARGAAAERVYACGALSPLDDELDAAERAARGTDKDAPVAGTLGLFNLLAEARERVALSYDTLLLYVRRTLQDDYYPPLLLLLHAFMEDDAELVHAVVDGARLAHAQVDAPPPPQLDACDTDDDDDDVDDGETEDETSEERAARERYEAALAEGAQRAATVAVFGFWPRLDEREPRALAAYYRYVAETRTDMREPPGRSTLADRLVFLAAALRAWRALPALLEAVDVRAATRLVLLDTVRVKCGAEAVASATRLQSAGLLSHRPSGAPLAPGREHLLALVAAAREPATHTLAALAGGARTLDLCCRVLLDGEPDDGGELDELRADTARAPVADELPPATGAPRVSKADALPREQVDLLEARFAAACHFARTDAVDELQELLDDPALEGNVWHDDGLLLRLAAARGAAECVCALLAREDVPDEARDVALGRAAEEHAPLAVLEALLDAGADAKAFESYALRRAAEFGDADRVRALLGAGAERRARHDEALYGAARAQDAGALAELLDGVALDDAEWSALSSAATPVCVAALNARMPQSARLAIIEKALEALDAPAEARTRALSDCKTLLETGGADLDTELDKLLAVLDKHE